MGQTGRDVHFFTTALEIAVILKAALTQAEEISLEAMNAKSIVARAGEGARAIQPIADHAEELADSIIRLVNQINSKSLEITRSSLAEFMEEVTVNYCQRAQILGRDAKFIDSLGPVTARADRRLVELHRKVEDHARSLSRLLDEIESILLAASIVTSKFRLEVGVSGSGYRANFEALVDKFERAVMNIRNYTRESQKTLAVGTRKMTHDEGGVLI